MEDNIIGKQIEDQPALAINFSPALYVFLGSTPAEIGWRIKKLQDDSYGDLPIFQYVWIDTDSKHTTDVEAWLKSQNVTEANIGQVKGAQILKKLDDYPSIQSWWPKNSKIRPGTFTRGANQVRIRGRFAYFALFNKREGNKPTIKDALENAASKVVGIDQAQAVPRHTKKGLTYSVDNSQVRVVIVNSVCGGTGSGIVFDVAYLLREYFFRNNVNAQMIGVQILPPVIEKAIKDMDHGQREKIKANGYSHLQDLDYLNETQKWKVDYPGHKIDVDYPVFDYTYLIDIANSMGKSLGNAEEIYKMISQSLFLISITPVAQELASHQDNMDTLSQVFKGKSAFASSFASASLVLPKERILKYCATRLTAESIGSITQNKYDSKAERPEHLELIDALGLRPEKLSQTLRQNQSVINNQLAFIQNAKNPGEALSIIVSEQTNDEYERREIINRFAETKQNTVEFFKQSIRKKALDYVSEFGPANTSGLLTSLLNDSKDSLSRYQQELENDLSGSSSRTDAALRELNDAKRSLGDLSKQFGSLISQWVTPKRWNDNLERDKAAVIDAMAKHNAAILNKELIALEKEIYSELTEEIKEIISTLANFSTTLLEVKGELDGSIDGIVRPTSDAHLFSLSREVVDGDYFAEFYENQIANIDKRMVFTEFIKQQMNFSVSGLKLFEKRDVKSALLNIAAIRFSGILENVNLLQEINRHYGSRATEVLERKIDEVLEYCSPFWRYGVGGENHNPTRPSYLGIENRNSPLLPQKYRENQGMNVTITSTGIKDAIYFTRVEHGVPLWMLTELRIWKSAYDKYLQTSDGTDPLNVIPEAAQDVLDPEDSKSVEEMFALALAFGFITQRGNYFYFDPEKIYQDTAVVPVPSDLIANGREKAARNFEAQSSWTNKMRIKILNEIGKIGVKQAVEQITNYCEKLEKEKLKLSVKNSNRNQLEKEIAALKEITENLQSKGTI